MKKLLFGFIALLMMLSANSSFAQVKPPIAEYSEILLELGRVSKNCQGFGICKFKVEISVEDVLAVIAAFSRSDGKITAVFSNEFYTKNKAKFQNGYLVVEEDYTIDRQTTRALKVADNYKIKTGKYLITFDKATNTYNCTF